MSTSYLPSIGSCRKIKLALIILGALASPAVSAGDSFDDIVAGVLASDPAFKAERLRMAAEIETLRAENSLENPEVDFGYKWGQGSTHENKWEISVSQSFDWPGVYASRRRAIHSRQMAAEASLRAWRNARGAEIRKLLVDYVSARRRLRINEEYSRNVDSVYAFSERMYEKRQLTVLDYRKARIERELARARVTEAQAVLKSCEAGIRALAGGETVDLTGLDEYPSSLLPDSELSESPRLGAAKWNILAAEADAQAASRSLFPGFSVGYVHEVEGSEHFNGISVGLTLPVWKGRKEKIAAKILAEASAENAEMTRREILAAMEAGRGEALALDSKASDLERALGDGQEYRALLDRSLEGGAITFFQYLDELNLLLDANLTVEELRAKAASIREEIRGKL